MNIRRISVSKVTDEGCMNCSSQYLQVYKITIGGFVVRLCARCIAVLKKELKLATGTPKAEVKR